MCIIIDTNLFSDYLQGTRDMAPVRKWLEGGRQVTKRGKLAYAPTNKFRAEVQRHPFRVKLVELRRAGLLKEVPVARVSEAEDKLPALVSDDSHVVALAVAGGVSVLVSKDHALHQDFKKVAKGKVYQKAAHKHLLTRDLCD